MRLPFRLRPRFHSHASDTATQQNRPLQPCDPYHLDIPPFLPLQSHRLAPFQNIQKTLKAFYLGDELPAQHIKSSSCAFALPSGHGFVIILLRTYG
jgi:hypothetical protein